MYQYAPFQEITRDKRTQARRGAQNKETDELGLRISGMCRRDLPDVGVAVTQFILDLEKSGYFKEVNLSEEEFDKEKNFYLFTILAKLKGSELDKNQ